LVNLVNGFARVAETPVTMFIDFVLGCTVKVMLAKFTSTGDMIAGAATIAVKRPKFGLDTVPGGSIKWAKIRITSSVLVMERWIEKVLMERLGSPRNAAGSTAILVEEPRYSEPKPQA
jgi:hypothetical protein